MISYVLCGVTCLQLGVIALLYCNRLQSKKALRLAEDQLKSAQQARIHILSNVSHELRTPMTAIKGYVDNLLDGIGGEINYKQNRCLKRVKANADRLIAQINDLLDVSRTDPEKRGFLRIRLQDISVSEVLENVVYDLTETAARKQLSVRVESTDAVVVADRDLLHRILNHLIGNAIKFTSQGKVRVSTRRDGTGYVQVMVRDSCPGIEEADLPRIFDRFFQVQDGRNLNPGAGLGLTIAKELTGILGGRIWVRSIVGRGSTFIVALPEPLPLSGLRCQITRGGESRETCRNAS